MLALVTLFACVSDSTTSADSLGAQPGNSLDSPARTASDPPPLFDEDDPVSVVSFTDPRDESVYDIVDGRVLVSFRNPPELEEVDPNYFDSEIPSNDEYLTAMSHLSPLEDEDIEDFIEAENLTVYSEWPVANSIAVLLPEGQTVEDAVENWPSEYDELISSVDADAMNYTDDWPEDEPTDQKYNDQWGIDDATGATDYDINIEQLWADDWENDDDFDYAAGTSSVVIAILDTGVQASHVDLQKNDTSVGANVGDRRSSTTITPRHLGGGEPWGWVQNDYPDKCGHGTMLAGITSAHINNDSGTPDDDRDIAGVCHDNQYIPIAMKYTGGYSQSSVNNGLLLVGCMKRIFSPSKEFPGLTVPYYNIEVLNISFGGRKMDPTAEFMLNYLADSIVVCCATGNDNSTLNNNYARHSKVLAVTSHDDAGYRSSFANYGSETDISAPGTEIYSTDMKGTNSQSEQLGYTNSSVAERNGTSYASPFVAGVAALVASADPGLTPSSIRSRLTSTALDLTNETPSFLRNVNAAGAVPRE